MLLPELPLLLLPWLQPLRWLLLLLQLLPGGPCGHDGPSQSPPRCQAVCAPGPPCPAACQCTTAQSLSVEGPRKGIGVCVCVCVCGGEAREGRTLAAWVQRTICTWSPLDVHKATGARDSAECGGGRAICSCAGMAPRRAKVKWRKGSAGFCAVKVGLRWEGRKAPPEAEEAKPERGEE